ncbi:hypothetical protein CFP56_041299 [Quercus suber]|uniref:Uncharacterized protein n=1 Tax=Quercus suber TaxID=58331 RepID=A0AAW0LK41_QUESU
MGSKAPGWGEQWSAEGYGGNDDDDKLMNKWQQDGRCESSSIGRTRQAASVSAQKVKSRTLVGIKWVKNQYQKKVSK